MCSNYRPATGRELAHYAVDMPEGAIAGKDVFPGGVAPMIFRAPDRAVRSCVAGVFGLLPAWAKAPDFSRHTYNARAETVAEKASYRHAWQHRQLCIVPAMAIYEPNYESGKSRWWRIQRADEQPMAIAGLWERKRWGDETPSWSFTMVTVNAAEHSVMRRFHKPGDEKRSVVILPDEHVDDWLTSTNEEQMRALMTLYPADLLSCSAGRQDSDNKDEPEASGDGNEKRGPQAALF